MDILCELPETNGGNKHILVISDYYTKWTDCFAMPNMEAKTVAKLLVEEVSQIWDSMCDSYGSGGTVRQQLVS